jgi:amidohydrolase
MSVTLDTVNSTCTEPVSVLSEVHSLWPEAVVLRRWFHLHPELSFKEFATVSKIAEILRSYGISELYECAKTGLVAVIRGGGGPGPCIALRADIDALPILESSDAEYASAHAGVMHACGHDGHITGLLLAAKVINTQKDLLRGSVKLLFQPAEEGYGGAQVMVREGCMDEGRFGPSVDSVYGIHLWSCKCMRRAVSAPVLTHAILSL